MSDYSAMRSKVRLRGTALVAWFADATPPVLWRWSTGDVSAGFGLRNQDNRVELLKHEPGVGSSVVAVFANEDRAAMALERLSRVLLDQKPQRATYAGGGRGFPRWLGGLSAFVLLLLLLGWLALHLVTSLFTSSFADSTAIPAVPGRALQQQARGEPNGYGGIIPGLPGSGATPARVAPAAPPVGKPVDVDSLYGK